MGDFRSFIKPEYWEQEVRRAAALAKIDQLIEAQRQAEAAAAADHEPTT